MSVGIVLGGGGARGAYEAGVLAGLSEVVGSLHRQGPFDVVCGTSVGAINAAWLAAHADCPDCSIDGLLQHWLSLSLERHLRPDVRSWFGRTRNTHLGRAVLDPSELERLVEDGVPWSRLRSNLDRGVLRALIVTALHVGSGRTTVFTDLAPGQNYPASRDPRRRHVSCDIRADHVLASAAVPMLFPARRVDDAFYADGGLRFNTPIAPALRMGVKKLVVIPLLKETLEATPLRETPTLVFLAGKLLDALLLDPIRYDLAVLERFNRLVTVLEESLSPAELERVHEAMTKSRGAPYRKVETLVFRPSEDIGAIALRRGESMAKRGWRGRALRRLTRLGGGADADLLSFVLFDGEHARELIDLGRKDVLCRRDEVRAFFER
ncbi:MAG: patatin-like phospholipase family protein [Myxococcota bacterium]